LFRIADWRQEHRWRKEFGGLQVDQARRMKELVLKAEFQTLSSCLKVRR
jgi:hypothetical protein